MRTSNKNSNEPLFESIRIVGALLISQVLREARKYNLPGQTLEDYKVPKGLKIANELGCYWRIAQSHWNVYQEHRQRTDIHFVTHPQQLKDERHRFSLSSEDFALIKPNTLTCPVFYSQMDAELTKKLYHTAPVLICEAKGDAPEQNPWGIRFQAMFHMSVDSGLFKTYEQLSELSVDSYPLSENQKITDNHLPLYEAKLEIDLDFVVPRVLELTYIADDLKPFAEDLGYTGAPFPFDPERRQQLKSELDAYYARLYGLTRDELRYILGPTDVMGEDYPSETFRVLKTKEFKEYGEYRTQRLVLEAFDALSETEYLDQRRVANG